MHDDDGPRVCRAEAKRRVIRGPTQEENMHQRSRRRDGSDRKACSSRPSQLGAGWTLTACCLLGCCLSAVPDLCSAFGTVGTASTAARSRSSHASNKLPIILSEELSLIKSHDVEATALGAATTATFEDVAALSQPEAGAVDDADETTKVGVLLLNLGGPETGEDVEGKLIGIFCDRNLLALNQIAKGSISQ